MMKNTQKKNATADIDPQILEALERNKVLRAQMEIAIRQYDEELVRTREAECKLKMLETTFMEFGQSASILETTFMDFGQRASIMAPMQSSIFRLNSTNIEDQISNALRADSTIGDQHLVQYNIEEVNVDENPSFKRRKTTQEILNTSDSQEKSSNQSELRTSYSRTRDMSVSSQILTNDKSPKGRKVASSLTSSSQKLPIPEMMNDLK